MRPENYQFEDFHMFWDQFHYDDDDYNDVCVGDEWNERNIECLYYDALSMYGSACSVTFRFNFCDFEGFSCQTENWSSGESYDCLPLIEGHEFWEGSIAEAWWYEEENMKLMKYVNCYYFGYQCPSTDDYNDNDGGDYNDYNDYDGGDHNDGCEWHEYNMPCSDYDALSMYGSACSVTFRFNFCDFEGFSCQTENWSSGESYDCLPLIESVEFWEGVLAETWWYDEENMELRTYVSCYYWGGDCPSTDDYNDYDDWDHDDYGHHDNDDNCWWREM
jgi:hypothetical protein